MGVTLSPEEFGFAGCLCVDRVLLGLQKADRLFAAGEGVVMLDLKVVDASAELLILCLQVHDLALKRLNSFICAIFGSS